MQELPYICGTLHVLSGNAQGRAHFLRFHEQWICEGLIIY